MNETCLRDGVFVSKDHPRIILRGALDSLQADILEAQVLVMEKNEPAAEPADKRFVGGGSRPVDYYVDALGEILEFVRELMSAEVNERPVAQKKLFGFSLDELHEQSHKLKMPVYTMGAFPVRLNTLRTRVRETELIAVRTFREPQRDDIVHALNRLSSAVYWLFCQY